MLTLKEPIKKRAGKEACCVPSGSVVKNLPAMQEAQETGVRSWGEKDPLKEAMATRSRVLAWRIPWTNPIEPGGLQSMGSQRADHD